jgi:hypothetical protein
VSLPELSPGMFIAAVRYTLGTLDEADINWTTTPDPYTPPPAGQLTADEQDLFGVTTMAELATGTCGGGCATS